MRVIAGEFRSRLIQSVPGLDVRPTPDRLREALFNVLAPQIENAVFADLYAGCGSVGIEALSRGASQAIFVEHNRTAIGILRKNLSSLGIESRADVRQARAVTQIPKIHADIAFLDPPYPLDQEYESALAALGEIAPSLVIVQHDRRRELKETYGSLRRARVLKQGDNCLTFYEPAAVLPTLGTKST